MRKLLFFVNENGVWKFSSSKWQCAPLPLRSETINDLLNKAAGKGKKLRMSITNGTLFQNSALNLQIFNEQEEIVYSGLLDSPQAILYGL